MSDTESPHAGLNIHQRLHAVMGRVGYIQKEQPKRGGEGLKYSILNYNRLVAKVRPLLVEYGVIVYPVEASRVQVGNRTEIDMVVRFICADRPESFLDVPSSGYGVDAQDKGPGKARTYSIKSALRDVLLLESGDDPDDDQSAASNHSDADPAIEAAKKARVAADKAERMRLYHLVLDRAAKSQRDELEVKAWLKAEAGGVPFMGVPLDIFERGIVHFEDMIFAPEGQTER